MREKLIELVNDILSYLPWGQISTTTSQEVADYLIANGVTIQKWIPVTERFPEENRRVLVCLSSKVTVVAYLRENIWYASWNGAVLKNIAHWMPLPEAPKEVE